MPEDNIEPVVPTVQPETATPIEQVIENIKPIITRPTTDRSQIKSDEIIKDLK